MTRIRKFGGKKYKLFTESTSKKSIEGYRNQLKYGALQINPKQPMQTRIVEGKRKSDGKKVYRLYYEGSYWVKTGE